MLVQSVEKSFNLIEHAVREIRVPVAQQSIKSALPEGAAETVAATEKGQGTKKRASNRALNLRIACVDYA